MEMPERIKENSDKTLTVYVDEEPFEIGEKQYLTYNRRRGAREHIHFRIHTKVQCNRNCKIQSKTV